jgi:AcrR family transcriptional regulator/DNA-binding MarR family transcriptional regulator
MAEEVAMRGASSVTVARVIARAGVSRRLFYELFADIEDCFLATFAWAIDQARAQAIDAYAAQDSWREALRGALAALLRFFDEQPLLAQLCVVHAAGGGPRVLELRSQTIAALCEVVDGGRAHISSSRVPGPVVAEGVVGAVLAVLYTRLLGESGTSAEEAPLLELHGELMSLIVLPYLGTSIARKELDRPPPPGKPKATPAEALPQGRPESEQRGARLTYRTVQVLRAIGELPAGSNREVAERAGIVDQGQISKILTRLEYQGLVVNRGGSGTARGTPNAWWLTERGEQLEQQLAERPAGEREPRRPGKRDAPTRQSG